MDYKCVSYVENTERRLIIKIEHTAVAFASFSPICFCSAETFYDVIMTTG